MVEQRSEQLRLFVACNLPDDVRHALSGLQEDLRRLGASRVRWVRAEGIHLTLKFLGAVEAKRVGEIGEALRGAIEPFELCVRPSTVGNFGGARMRVLWVGLDGDIQGLAELASRVDMALGPLGFPAEGRPFAAHLTLARVPDQASPGERRELEALVKRYQPPALPSMALSRVELMQSTLGREGSVYRALASFPRPAGPSA